jgi:hypothetical protein
MIRKVITFRRHHREPMVGRSIGSVSSDRDWYSKRLNR